jgi:hypothetical protein
MSGFDAAHRASSSFLHAQSLIGQGLPCFPCLVDKRPATPHGFKDATSDSEVLSVLWRRHPGPLVGVPTGAPSCLDVLDIDPRNGGHRWFEEHRHPLRQTRVHETRSGGLHVFFRHDAAIRCSAGKIAPGIDVRATGGYVIWWPAAGLRVLSDAPIAPLPDWLGAELCRGRNRRQHASGCPMGTRSGDWSGWSSPRGPASAITSHSGPPVVQVKWSPRASLRQRPQPRSSLKPPRAQVCPLRRPSAQHGAASGRPQEATMRETAAARADRRLRASVCNGFESNRNYIKRSKRSV